MRRCQSVGKFYIFVLVLFELWRVGSVSDELVLWLVYVKLDF